MKNSIKYFFLLTLGVIISFTTSSFASSDTKTEEQEKATSTALVLASKSSALLAVSRDTTLTLSVKQRSSVWAQNLDGFALMLPSPKSLAHLRPHEIQYEVLYTFKNGGTIGPVKIYNNLANTGENKFFLSLGVSDGAYKRKSGEIGGKNAWIFPTLNDGRKYTSILRQKDSSGITEDLTAEWFLEHHVTKLDLDEDSPFHCGEPFMFVQVGLLPPIDFTGR